MSTTTAVPESESVSADLRHVVVVSRKTPIALAIITALLALLYVLVPREGYTHFRFSNGTERWQVPTLTVDGMTTAWLSVVLCVLLVLVSVAYVVAQRKVPAWVPLVFAFLALVGFLAWAGAGSSAEYPVVSLVGGSVLLAVPLVFGALGGVIGERAGVVNIAIEAQLLFGAFGAAIFSSLTHNPYIGTVAAMFAGVLVALVLGVFAIKYRVDQVIVGVVLNVLVYGLTDFLYSQVLVPNGARLNTTTRFQRIAIPGLSEIPVIGPALFRQTILVYVMYVSVPIVWFALFRTRWGLRLRSVGEHPKAADTVGIKVERVRYRALAIAGAVVGIGGAFYTVVSISSFGREMTAGAGYIALAAVIFGKWDPVRAALAALLFGAATNLQGTLSVVGAPVPSQFMLMLPYVVTILAVAGFVGRSRAPAADGQPYIKE
jgi:simple sugar transport system permease protein